MSICVPHRWLLRAIVALSSDGVATGVMVSTDELACGGSWEGMAGLDRHATNTPTTNTAAAAAATAHVSTRERRRCQATLFNRDVRSSGRSGGGALAACPSSSIWATSSLPRRDSSAGMPLISATASRHGLHVPICASNSRRSAGDSEPSTYAASHIMYSSLCPDGVCLRPKGIAASPSWLIALLPSPAGSGAAHELRSATWTSQCLQRYRDQQRSARSTTPDSTTGESPHGGLRTAAPSRRRSTT